MYTSDITLGSVGLSFQENDGLFEFVLPKTPKFNVRSTKHILAALSGMKISILSPFVGDTKWSDAP